MSEKQQTIPEQINILGDIVNNLTHRTSFKVKLAFYKARARLKKLISTSPDRDYRAPRSDQDYPT